MDGAHCGPLRIERSLSRAVQPAHSEMPPVVRNERRPSAGLAGHRVRGSGRTGVGPGVADSARTRRRSSEDRCLDVVRTVRRQRAARERRQAVRGPGAVVTASAKHGAIVSVATHERPRLASSPPGTLCLLCAARTPLVVTPMQAVSAGPARAPRSMLPLTPKRTGCIGATRQPEHPQRDCGSRLRSIDASTIRVAMELAQAA